VAIEYQLPQSSKRIDFMITGEDAAGRTKVVIVELKQWSESRRSEKDAIVWRAAAAVRARPRVRTLRTKPGRTLPTSKTSTARCRKAR